MPLLQDCLCRDPGTAVRIETGIIPPSDYSLLTGGFIMKRWLAFVALAALLVALPANAAGISGKYIEARTCDIWTGPCFANSEMNLGGKNAVLGWKIDKGEWNGVKLDGLGVVAVLATSDTLGLEQTGPGKAVLIVDERATSAQKDALVRLVQKQGGKLVKNIVAVHSAKIELTLCECENKSCAILEAGKAHIETRCFKDHDKICGHEDAFYPPLAKNVTAKPAVASNHGYTGDDIHATWTESNRRGAYVGTFEVR
jgi:hypothetical protein